MWIWCNNNIDLSETWQRKTLCSIYQFYLIMWEIFSIILTWCLIVQGHWIIVIKGFMHETVFGFRFIFLRSFSIFVDSLTWFFCLGILRCLAKLRGTSPFLQSIFILEGFLDSGVSPFLAWFVKLKRTSCTIKIN